MLLIFFFSFFLALRAAVPKFPTEQLESQLSSISGQLVAADNRLVAVTCCNSLLSRPTPASGCCPLGRASAGFLTGKL